MSLAKPKNQTITPATVPITVAARLLFETFMSYTTLENLRSEHFSSPRTLYSTCANFHVEQHFPSQD